MLDPRARADARRAVEDLALEQGSACLLGPSGEILFVNEAWDRFAQENGGAPAALGATLLGKRYTGFVAGLAERSFHDGVLLRVQSGQRVSIRTDCSSPDADREIESVFRPVRLGTGMGAAVVHNLVRELRHGSGSERGPLERDGLDAGVNPGPEQGVAGGHGRSHHRAEAFHGL